MGGAIGRSRYTCVSEKAYRIVGCGGLEEFSPESGG